MTIRGALISFCFFSTSPIILSKEPIGGRPSCCQERKWKRVTSRGDSVLCKEQFVKKGLNESKYEPACSLNFYGTVAVHDICLTHTSGSSFWHTHITKIPSTVQSSISHSYIHFMNYSTAYILYTMMKLCRKYFVIIMDNFEALSTIERQVQIKLVPYCFSALAQWSSPSQA